LHRYFKLTGIGHFNNLKKLWLETCIYTEFKIQRMMICTSVDTIERCAMCYFVNSGHCDIEFYMFQNVSSYEAGASYELGTSVLINL
jgi:hypothetical protein